MRVLLAVTALVLLIATATPAVHAQADQFRPPKVPVGSWIPLGPDAGFVVVDEVSATKDNRTGPKVSGFLMGRHNGVWVRLELAHASALVPAS